MSGGNGGGAYGGAGGTGYLGQNGGRGTAFYGGGGGGGAGSSLFGGRNGGNGAGSGGGVGGAGGGSQGNTSPNGLDGAAYSGNRGGGGGGGAGLAGTAFGGVGGNGGAGGEGGGGGGGFPSYGGGGGAGGYGSSSSSPQVLINGSYRGGQGGNGGPGLGGQSGGFVSALLFFGAGGDGGSGFYAGAAGVAVTVSGGATAVGGAGGYGPSHTVSMPQANLGSQGGAGLFLSDTASGATVSNAGQVTGGAGGGRSGSGGAGVKFAGSGGTLTNSSTGVIQGGAGPRGGYGAAGAGVTGAGLTIKNSGRIEGPTDALTFTGGANVLALGGADADATSNNGFSGAIDIQAGTLSFNQAAFASTPDVTFVATITGAGAMIKDGAGTLTLSGANTYSGGTTIDAGTLAVAADGNLGATSGGLTFAGGTLEATASFTSARTVALSVNNGMVRVDGGIATTLSGVVSGVGSLIKTGAGRLTLSGANTYTGGAFIDAGTLSVASDGSLGGGLILQGGTLETTATFTSARTVQLAVAGTVQVDTGKTTTLSGRITSGDPNAVLTKTGAGTLVLSNRSNTFVGTTIAAGTLDVAGKGSAGTGALTFAGASGSPATLILETAAQNLGGTFQNTLTNFGENDAIDVKSFAYTASDVVHYDQVTDLLTVANGTSAESFTLDAPHQTDFVISSDGNGGTLVTDPVCFAAGTRIRTVRGDVAVEDLAVGDLVVTSSGQRRPIRWLGHRRVDCRSHPRPHACTPVRVAAHAFGEGRPARHLYVSPGHSLCVDVVGEVLIMASALINGTTVTREDVERVTYWHIELDGHDILLAENLACESYLEMGNRGFFAESEVVALDASPDVAIDSAPARTHADFCRPFHGEGALVEVVRARLSARARRLGWRLEEQGLGDLHLLADGVRLDPRVRGLAARFIVPAGARDVWLVSRANTPKAVADWPDERRLGACLKGLAIDDGFGATRAVSVDDPRLCVGFHTVEGDGERTWRWTAGRARLPASLWDGLDDDVFLRVELNQQALPRWVAPAVAYDDGKASLAVTAW